MCTEHSLPLVKAANAWVALIGSYPSVLMQECSWAAPLSYTRRLAVEQRSLIRQQHPYHGYGCRQ